MQEKRVSGISKELVFRLCKVDILCFLAFSKTQIVVTKLVMVTVRTSLPSSHF